MATRKGQVYVRGTYAGTIEQQAEQYVFQYDKDYLNSKDPVPVSLTLPLREAEYSSKSMFPFFDGLIPEGWLLDLTTRNWKLESRDRMGLLLTACEDCIGAVHVKNSESSEQ